MSRFLLPLLLTTYFAVGPLPHASCTAQGIDFFTGSWAEALARAEAEDKLLFVDAYAEWCGPCKVMTARVFPDPEVGAYFNANFISVKYDMEKAESEEFRRFHNVSAYPTLLFIDSGNELVHRLVGARQSAQLLKDAAAALARTEDLDELESAYEAGKTGAAYRYVRALVRNGEPHLRVANDYLRDPATDFTAPATLRLISLAATEADSRLFDLLVKYRAPIEQLEGSDAWRKTARAATAATFAKALDYRDERLMATAVTKLALIDKEEAKRLESEGTFALALGGNDRKTLVRATKNYLKRGAAGDEDRLRRLFQDLTEATAFIDYSEVIDLAVEAGTTAADLSEEGWRDRYRIARFLQERRRYDQALSVAERSLADLADGPANYRRAVRALVDELRGAVE